MRHVSVRVLSAAALTLLFACVRTPAGSGPLSTHADELATGRAAGALTTSGGHLGPPAALGGSFQAAGVLSPTRFVAVSLAERKLVVRVGEVTGDAVEFGAPEVLADNEDGIDNVGECAVVALDESHVALVHRAESQELRVNLGTVEGRAIHLSYGPRNGAPVFDNNGPRKLSAIPLAANRFLLAYDAIDSESGSWRAYLQLGAAENGQIRPLEKIALARDAKEDTALARLGPSSFVLAVRGFADDYLLRVHLGTFENDRLRLGVEETLPGVTPTHLFLTALGPEKFLLGYKTSGSVPGKPPPQSMGYEDHFHVGSVFHNGLVIGPGTSYESTAYARVFAGASTAEQLAFAAEGLQPQQPSAVRLATVFENQIKLGSDLVLPPARIDGLVRLDARRLLLAQPEGFAAVVRTAELPEPPGPGDITVDKSNDLLSVPLAGGKFLVAYSDQAHGRRGVVTLGELRDGRVVVGGRTEVFGTGVTWDIHGVRLADSRFALAYKEGRTAKVLVGTLEGDRLVLGPPTALELESGPSMLSISVLGPDRVALAYRTTDSPGAVVFGTLAGDRVTFGDRFLFDAGKTAVGVASVGLGPAEMVVVYGTTNPQGLVSYFARGVRTAGPTEVLLSEKRAMPAFLNPRLTALGAGAFAASFGGPMKDPQLFLGQLVLGTFDGHALAVQPPAVVSTRHTPLVTAAALAGDRVLVSYASGESLQKPFTAAYARTAHVHGGEVKFSDEAVLTNEAAPQLSIAPLADGSFVVSYAVGADSARATTRLGILQPDGGVSWKD